MLPLIPRVRMGRQTLHVSGWPVHDRGLQRRLTPSGKVSLKETLDEEAKPLAISRQGSVLIDLLSRLHGRAVILLCLEFACFGPFYSS